MQDAEAGIMVVESVNLAPLAVKHVYCAIAGLRRLEAEQGNLGLGCHGFRVWG